jgi:hypothetical protein
MKNLELYRAFEQKRVEILKGQTDVEDCHTCVESGAFDIRG